MDNVADDSPPRHAPAARVTPDRPLRLFAAPVTFLPVRAVPDPPGPFPCWAHPTAISPPVTGEPRAVIDWRSRLGGWRRETVCLGCVPEFLLYCSRSFDETVCWFVSAAPDALDVPRPLGQLAQWPPEMPGVAV